MAQGDVQNAVKPHTLRSYENQCNNHIKPALGAIKLHAIATHQIQAFYNKLLPSLSAKSIKNVHGVLNSALKKAVNIGYLKYNPAHACTLPRVVKKEIVPMEDNAQAAFLKAIKGHRFEALYQVTLFTGMRQGEILGLT